MTGTEKQVAWAEDIKRKTLDGLDSSIKFNEDYASKYGCDYAERAEMCRIYKQAVEQRLFASAKMQSAAYVIEHRNSIPDVNTVIDQATMIASNKGENKLDVLRKMCRI